MDDRRMNRSWQLFDPSKVFESIGKNEGRVEKTHRFSLVNFVEIYEILLDYACV